MPSVFHFRFRFKREVDGFFWSEILVFAKLC